ncbi:Ubiquitin fusion degradation protein 3 homolog [Caenorhabditis elegans]|uniref:Isoform a of Ubiquitin fusion degradation protein 3 homolog n=1 Tax=Caenorhabditis elegans TaxID=6239 RepID=G5EES6-2|nr:Ubiquitin fusion degradation protein 3 homolog [Caenorhabditis elegans]CAA88206.1 Ubiquitin fusion degradation protein 3 homolog [Caenorhabditis elegans]|eukprot:NP_496147.1 Ubiquitin fusion degradation protein 3 homolog [Caenorhabditis elegans]
MADDGLGDVPMETESMPQYTISHVIEAHKSDTKALAVTQGGCLISGGRDETVKFWAKKGKQYTKTHAFEQPKGITVNSIAYAELADGWRLFVGRRDGTIAVFGPSQAEPYAIFNEHKQNVCCLHINEKATHMLSGSWDSNVIIWPITELNSSSFTTIVCPGHTLSVWALASFPDLPNTYLSASADKTIRMWFGDTTLSVFKGHTDVVRALVVLSSSHFLSAGNDGHIIHWDVASASILRKFATQAHEFIYSMTLSDSHILTTGEDGTLEFWAIDGGKDGNLAIVSEAVIQLPTTNTWDAKVLLNSDIAVAGSDGRIYIMTTDKNRKADDDILDAFDAEVVAKLTAKTERMKQEEHETVTIKVDIDDRPTQLNLKYKKGTDPGLCAQEFLSENNLPIHYLEEITRFIKDRIPEARAFDLKSGKKVIVDGKEYDYALGVNFGKGEPDKQMPFNVNESPQFAAQRFVERHQLPVSVIPSLAGMISQEMDKLSKGAASAQSGYEDPFTGPGRYVPQGSSNSGGHGADPFTGSGRYVPQASNSSGFDTGFSGDPLTGDGGYRASAPENTGSHAVPLSSLPQNKKKPRGPLVPVPDFYIIGLAGKGEKAIAKLKELNEKQDAFQLNPDQINGLEELFVLPTSSNYSSEVTQSAFEMSLQWPVEHLTPVLDFLRIALTHHSLNSYFCDRERGQELVGRLIAILVSDPADVALKVLVCRCIANAFSHPVGRNLFASTELSTLAPLVVRQVLNEKTVLQMSAATALANWSLALLQQSEQCEQLGPKEDLLRAILNGIESVDSFGYLGEDAIIRLLQALVTVMWGDASVIRLAKNRNIAQIAARLKDAVSNDSGKNIARDIVEMTYAV